MKETKLRNAMRFYLLATQLKYKIKSGWKEINTQSSDIFLKEDF